MRAASASRTELLGYNKQAPNSRLMRLKESPWSSPASFEQIPVLAARLARVFLWDQVTEAPNLKSPTQPTAMISAALSEPARSVTRFLR